MIMTATEWWRKHVWLAYIVEFAIAALLGVVVGMCCVSFLDWAEHRERPADIHV